MLSKNLQQKDVLCKRAIIIYQNNENWLKKDTSVNAPEDNGNIAAAKMLVDNGYNVTLLTADKTCGTKTADAIIENQEWEIKTNRTPTKNAIDNELRTASKQADRVVLNILSDIPKEKLRAAIANRFRRENNLISLILIQGNNVKEFSRKEILSWEKNRPL